MVQASGTAGTPNIFRPDTTRTNASTRRMIPPGAREEIREPR